MRMKDHEAAPTHMILRATLLDVRPRVWRRLRVPASCTLARLHAALQGAFGWRDCHTHQFHDGDHGHGDVDDEEDPVAMHVAQGTPLVYEYDMGDSWEHLIELEGTEARAEVEEGDPCCCLAGGGACPPEDVGGAMGYMELLRAVKDPSHPDHREHVRAVGGRRVAKAYDPRKPAQAFPLIMRS